MFKVYNHYLQKEEIVAKIDLNKHWKSFGVPFDSIPEDIVVATTIEEGLQPDIIETPIEELIINAAPKPRGRPKAN